MHHNFLHFRTRPGTDWIFMAPLNKQTKKGFLNSINRQTDFTYLGQGGHAAAGSYSCWEMILVCVCTRCELLLLHPFLVHDWFWAPVSFAISVSGWTESTSEALPFSLWSAWGLRSSNFPLPLCPCRVGLQSWRPSPRSPWAMWQKEPDAKWLVGRPEVLLKFQSTNINRYAEIRKSNFSSKAFSFSF